MPFGDYLVGLALFTGTFGAVGLAAAIVVRRRLSHLTGAPRIVAFALLWIAGFVAVNLVPAALGVLDRVPVLLAALAVLVAASRVPTASTAASPAPAPAARSDVLSRVLAGAAVVAVGLYALAFLREHATQAIVHSDYVHFTMPQIARWIQSGSIWSNIEFNPQYPVGAYPNNGDVWLLGFVLPWKNDAFVRLAGYPLVALVGLATYALARELRVPAAPAALFAAVVVATRAVTIPAIDYVKPDIFMLATFAAGALFLLRAFRTRLLGDLVLAGVGLGLAFGARWYGLPFVAALAAAWVLGSLLAGRARPAVARQALVLTLVIAAAGGIWLIRNLAITGNPVYPVKVAALGVTVFDAPRAMVLETNGFTIADYLGRPADLRSFILPEWRAAIGASGLVAGVGVLLAIAAALRRRASGGREWVVATVAGLALLIASVYLVLPGTAQGRKEHPFPGLVAANSRYLMPALVLAAPAAAWAATRLGRFRALLCLAAAVAVVEGLVAQPRSAFAGIAPFDVGMSNLAQVALGMAVLLGAASALRTLHRRSNGRPARRLVVAGVALAALVVVVAVGQVDQRRFNDHRYRGADPTIDWMLDHARSGHRIGVTGIWNAVLVGPTLPAFGPRFGNHVAYVGPIERGMLQYYEARQPFLAAVRRGRYDLMVVGRGFVPAAAPSREERWLRSAGFTRVVEGERFTLMRPPRVES